MPTFRPAEFTMPSPSSGDHLLTRAKFSVQTLRRMKIGKEGRARSGIDLGNSTVCDYYASLNSQRSRPSSTSYARSQGEHPRAHVSYFHPNLDLSALLERQCAELPNIAWPPDDGRLMSEKKKQESGVARRHITYIHM